MLLIKVPKLLSLFLIMNLQNRTNMLGIIEYLYTLTTVQNIPLYQSNRKTSVIGFGAAVKSILAISRNLLSTSNFKFVMTYKFSQEHE